jgi:hypothetical protein
MLIGESDLGNRKSGKIISCGWRNEQEQDRVDNT